MFIYMGRSSDEEGEATSNNNDNNTYSINSHLSRFKDSFLFNAARGGRVSECASLLDIGADPNWIQHQSSDNTGNNDGNDNNEENIDDLALNSCGGDTPFLVAVRKSHSEIVSLFLAQANLNIVNSISKDSALHLAVERGDEDICRLLLSKFSSNEVEQEVENEEEKYHCRYVWCNLKNKKGETAVDIAIRKGYMDLGELILKQQWDQEQTTEEIYHAHNNSQLTQTAASTRVSFSPSPFSSFSDDDDVDDDSSVLSHNNSRSNSSSSSGGVEIEQVQWEMSGDEEEEEISDNNMINNSQDENDDGEDYIEQARQWYLSQRNRNNDVMSTTPTTVDSVDSSNSDNDNISDDDFEQHRQRYSLIENNLVSNSNNNVSSNRINNENLIMNSMNTLILNLETENTDLKEKLEKLRLNYENVLNTNKSESKKEENHACNSACRITDADFFSKAIEKCTNLEELKKIEESVQNTVKKISERKEYLLNQLLEGKEEETSQQLCVICQVEKKSVLLIPCRHLCLCQECSRNTDMNGKLLHCPLCRVKIEDKIHVFA